MAKRTAAAVSRRASLRTQLKDATYTQIKSMLESGKLSESDIRLYYSDIRADMQRQIKRIDKSDVKFIDRPDDPPSARDLKNILDVAKAAADANKFVRNKSMSTIKGRRAVRAKSIETLHKRGITSVNEENYDLWVRFSRWYETRAQHFKYGSDSAEITETFETADEFGFDDSAAWEEALTYFKEEVGY